MELLDLVGSLSQLYFFQWLVAYEASHKMLQETGTALL